MNSKTLFALIVGGLTVAASAQTSLLPTPKNQSPVFGIDKGTTTNGSQGASGLLTSGLPPVTSTGSTGITVQSMNKHKPPVVTPEPMTMLAFLPGLLLFKRRRKSSV